MKKILGLLVLSALAASPAFAVNPYDEFKARAAAQGATAIEAFAKDLGGVIGANDFHSASVPGLPGFDVGVAAAVQLHPDKNNTILKNAGVDKFGLPMARVEAGLPLGFSVFVRGIPNKGASLIGGGARFQVYKSGLIIAIPDIAVTVAYDKLTHDIADLNHMGASVQASFNLPIIKPFIGVGFDSTKVTAKDATLKSGLTTAGLGHEFTGKGTRVTAGASLTLIPFTYVFGAVNLLHGETAGQLGLGIKFGGIL